MILTLSTPGTSVNLVKESLKVHVPPMGPRFRGGRGSSDDGGEDGDEGGNGQPAAPATTPAVQFQVGITQLTSIVVSANVHITVPVLNNLARHAVPVIFVHKNRPVAVLNPFATHGSVEVRKAQFKAIDASRGFHVARETVRAAMENKARLLLLMAKNRSSSNPGDAATLQAAAAAIRAGETRLDVLPFSGNPSSDRYALMGIEGDGARQYFEALQAILPPALNFTGRNRRPPKDPVNAMLSLGYAVLQGYVTVALAATGLEPYAGFLHADRSGKPSLVLDMMESFRQPLVDRLVLKLVNLGSITVKDFVTSSSGVQLTQHGFERYMELLARRIGPMRPDELERATETNHYKDIVQQARDLSRFLLGQASTPRMHLMDW